MTQLPDDYLSYPNRKYGMDHQRYSWSMLVDRPKVSWPDKKLLAVTITVNLEFFPLNQKGQPFKVPGGMTMPYPDLRHFTLREYGNRVGVYRVLEAFKQHGITPTIAMNGQVALRDKYLCHEIHQMGCEIVGHGWNMDTLHYGGMDLEAERDQISRTRDVLMDAFGGNINGWLSPAKSQSQETPDLLKELGFSYMMDWVNDDMPYDFKTRTGAITAFPLSTELEDRFLLMQNHQSEQMWQEQVLDAGLYLIEEASQQGGRILSLNIHPWLMGQPHRIKYLEQVLGHLSRRDEVWFANPSEIINELSS